jgi:Ser/Thr protein kinase RdoA (MazF antagonist)
MGRVSRSGFQGTGVLFPESPRFAVTDAYPLAGVVWTALGSAGGFSGSRIWRGASADGQAFALKGYPPGRVDRRALEATVHRWIWSARLSFVPRLEKTRDGRTAIEADGRVWEVATWMPGRADFRDRPTDNRLTAAAIALAELHKAWAPGTAGILPAVPGPKPAPAVARRLSALADWTRLVESGWRPSFRITDGPIRESAETAWRILPAHVRRSQTDLEPWRSIRVATHPCLCDLWHDHVMYEGDCVVGLIDFGAAKVDHPAVDLARLLGSLVPDEPARFVCALDAYRSVSPLAHPELVPLLDRTGTVVAAIHWLRAVYLERRAFSDPAGIAQRLEEIVRRLLRWG